MERSITVGVGCTTYNRPECLAKWKQQISKHTKHIINSKFKKFVYDRILTKLPQVYVYVADDSKERKGVAYRKNECLRALKDCDYVFLFDDDCYPIKDNWIDFFIKSKFRHLLFLTDKHKRLYTVEDANVYRDCGGVFMYMTKDCIERVGAFNEKYRLWGIEHVDYSNRIYGKKNNYLCKIGTENYIYSEDYSNPNHKSSIGNEEKEYLFKENFPKLLNEKEVKYIPL